MQSIRATYWGGSREEEDITPKNTTTMATEASAASANIRFRMPEGVDIGE